MTIKEVQLHDLRFNTTLVQLKDGCAHFPRPRLSSRFNTTLVQLKDHPPAWVEELAGGFQYHTGSIKSVMFKASDCKGECVSIPHWFN